jgi:dihydrofolate synthase/folylpolyglutamate synthase
LKRCFPGVRWTVLNGFLKDKDAPSCVRMLAPFASNAVVTMPVSDRAEDGGKVVQAWERQGVPVRWVGDTRQALQFARSHVHQREGLLICGSLYLDGDLRGILKGPKDLEII